MSTPCAITYLSGLLHADLFGTACLGMMMAPGSTKTVPQGMPVALDNGAFGGKYRGDDFFLRWLDKQSRAGVLFAVSPDVVGDADGTLKRSLPMLPRIRDLGFPVAYAGQDGFDAGVVPWELMDVLFIGGSTQWKMGMGGREAIAAAHQHGKAVHFGRANSWTRLAYAAGLGCVSADGTTIKYNPGRYVSEVKSWVSRLNAPRLLDVAAVGEPFACERGGVTSLCLCM